MDWKYKHFHQERVYSAPRDEVLEAARTFMAQSLGWKITETAAGFKADGYSFTHQAIADFQVRSDAGGSRIVVELLVERAGWRGFMLFDVGGYYSIQMRKWLDGVQWELHQRAAGTREESQNPIVLAQNKASAHLFNGCLVFIVVMFALYAVVTLICALVGLFTGNLYLIGRGGTLALHGLWGRIASALILMFGIFLVWRIKHKPSHYAN